MSACLAALLLGRTGQDPQLVCGAELFAVALLPHQWRVAAIYGAGLGQHRPAVQQVLCNDVGLLVRGDMASSPRVWCASAESGLPAGRRRRVRDGGGACKRPEPLVFVRRSVVSGRSFCWCLLRGASLRSTGCARKESARVASNQ